MHEPPWESVKAYLCAVSYCDALGIKLTQPILCLMKKNIVLLRIVYILTNTMQHLKQLSEYALITKYLI